MHVALLKLVLLSCSLDLPEQHIARLSQLLRIAPFVTMKQTKCYCHIYSHLDPQDLRPSVHIKHCYFLTCRCKACSAICNFMPSPPVHAILQTAKCFTYSCSKCIVWAVFHLCFCWPYQCPEVTLTEVQTTIF